MLGREKLLQTCSGQCRSDYPRRARPARALRHRAAAESVITSSICARRQCARGAKAATLTRICQYIGYDAYVGGWRLQVLEPAALGQLPKNC